MAELFPNEGLDYLLSIVPKGGTSPTTLYLGLFTSQTASTVLTATQTLAANITEASYTGYTRIAVASTDWGTAGAKTIWTQPVRGVDGSQKSFPAATASYSTPINGFFISSTSVVSAGICIWASNFDDITAVSTMAIGDIIKVTPTWGFGG
jgi:hypothetical protein